MTVRSASSPTRSRATACRSQATRTTMPGLMTPTQVEGFRAEHGHPPRPRMGPCSRGSTSRRRPCWALSRRGAVRPAGPPPLRGPGDPGAGAKLRDSEAGLDVDASRASAWCCTRSPRPTAPSPARIVTTSPDVTVSTNLGAWVNRRGLFAKASDGRPLPPGAHSLDLQLGPSRRTGQHLELGIAEIEPVHPRSRRSACRIRSSASACCRSARSTIPSSSAASMP